MGRGVGEIGGGMEVVVVEVRGGGDGGGGIGRGIRGVGASFCEERGREREGRESFCLAKAFGGVSDWDTQETGQREGNEQDEKQKVHGQHDVLEVWGSGYLALLLVEDTNRVV